MAEHLPDGLILADQFMPRPDFLGKPEHDLGILAAQGKTQAGRSEVGQGFFERGQVFLAGQDQFEAGLRDEFREDIACIPPARVIDDWAEQVTLLVGGQAFQPGG